MESVPWKNWDEWVSTYELLYSENSLDVQRGCNIVFAWMSKQLIPIAIESTAEILSALRNQKNVYELSLAIIRFVNGVIEPYKDVKISSSIQNLCEFLNIPNDVLNIRNLATHGCIPSYYSCSNVAEECLSWLKKYYWEEQMKLIVERREDCFTQILNFFHDGSLPFVNKSKHEIAVFGYPELIKVITSPEEVSTQIENNKLCELLNYLDTFIPNSSQYIMSEIYKLSLTDSTNAKKWYEYLSNYFRPLPNYINFTPKASFPPISIGDIPSSDNSLTLNDDEIGYAEINS